MSTQHVQYVLLFLVLPVNSNQFQILQSYSAKPFFSDSMFIYSLMPPSTLMNTWTLTKKSGEKYSSLLLKSTSLEPLSTFFLAREKDNHGLMHQRRVMWEEQRLATKENQRQVTRKWSLIAGNWINNGSCQTLYLKMRMRQIVNIV